MPHEKNNPGVCDTDTDLIDELGIDPSLNTEIASLGKPSVPSPFTARSYSCFVSDHDRVLARISVRNLQKNLDTGASPASFELAGPRREIFFEL